MSDDRPDVHVDSTEPSMEDILASIRQIIADEDVTESANLSSTEAESPQESFTIVEANEDVVPAPEAADDDDDILSLLDSDVETEAAIQTVDAPEVASDESLGVEELLMELEPNAFAEPLELNVLAEESVVAPVTTGASKLSGLGAVAAASLGAAASAGAVAAEKLTKARSNPSPQPMNDAPVQESGDDAFDLLLNEEAALTVSDLDTDDELESLLQIPDADVKRITGDDDLDALLGDIMFDDNDMTINSDERVVDPAEELLDNETEVDELLADLLVEDMVSGAELPVPAQSSSDLDLVKSLMADLTDDPYAETADVSESSEIIGNESNESDVLDEILSLSMDDEFAEPSEVLSPDEFIIDVNKDLPNFDEPAEKPSSLASIAQAAEADAAQVERKSRFGTAGFAAGAGLVAASATLGETEAIADTQPDEQDAEDIIAAMMFSNDDEIVSEAEAQVDEQEISKASNMKITEITEITPQQETADMPKAAAKKDTIVDEVTEEASAGAFASLNKIVEDKAVVEERGDRIGDLVQEALRPMLKEWLDKNLKGIVERAVTKEVKRISTGK